MERKSLFGIAALLLLCSLNAAAQPDTMWTRTYGIYGGAIDLFRADNGDILLISTISTWEVWDFSLSRFSIAGDSIWSYSYGDEDFSGACLSATLLANGNILALASEGGDALRLYEIDQSGELIRTQQLSDSVWWNAVRAFPYGGYILRGTVFRNSFDDVVLKRILDSGEETWTIVYGQPQYSEHAWDLEVDDQGRSLLVGVLVGEEGEISHMDAWIALVDSTGEQTWETVYPYDLNNFFNLGTLTHGVLATNGIYVCGSLDYGSSVRGWVVKLNLEGDSLWSRRILGINNPNMISINGLTLTENGDLVGVGMNGAPGSTHMFRMDTEGNLLWQDCCPVTPFATETATRVVAIEDGSFLIAGEAYDNVEQRVIRLTRTTPDDVSADPTPRVPTNFALSNFPNPFNPTTEIEFTFPRAMNTSLRVFDLLGREVATLTDGNMTTGSHRIAFDGSSFASGLYFCTLTTPEFTTSRKMLLLK